MSRPDDATEAVPAPVVGPLAIASDGGRRHLPCRRDQGPGTLGTMDLLDHAMRGQIEKEAPLAHRMRPRTLDDYVGQSHIVGPGRLLRRAIQADQLSSVIFCGPPGTGKTTLASVIAGHTRSHFVTINAVLAGVKEIRETIDDALSRRRAMGIRTTLFVDEVHRWNKAQQDALLPHVENGTLILIGATTENPYFEVNKALVSRSRIFQLKPLEPESLRELARRAIADPERGYGRLNVEITDEALDHLTELAGGDARAVLNALELAVQTTAPGAGGLIRIDLTVAEESIQRRAMLYDKDGDVHFDTISAFIKSLRGSDPDAALYWMARMVHSGEDPRFVFRRMAILAGEDVGLADPAAAGVVASCWEIFERVGMPEGRYALAQAALYLATCPKSNSTMAFFDALAAVEKEGVGDVPNSLKDASRDGPGFGHGQGYLYPHAYRDHWVGQQYLPGTLQGRLFYQPSDQGYEKAIREQVERRRELQLAAVLQSATQAAPEILSTSPQDRGKEAWLERTIAASSRTLEVVRDALFSRAALARHHLVLVVDETTGLFTWEALRRCPEGGVWALAPATAVRESLGDRARRLPELERPHVVEGSSSDAVAALDRAGHGAVRFDRVLWNNPCTSTGAMPAPSAQLGSLLLEGAALVVAQTVPRLGQRLVDLVNFAGAPRDLETRVRGAEASLFEEGDDAMTSWDPSDLKRSLEALGFVGDIEVETFRTPRTLSTAQVNRWLDAQLIEGGRPSYAQRLIQRGIAQEELERLAPLYRSSLQGQTVSWSTTVLFAAVRPTRL